MPQLSANPIDRRRFLQLGLGVSAGLLVAACGGSDSGGPAAAAGDGSAAYTGGKVTLDFWNPLTGGDGPYMRRIVDAFSRGQADIDVTMTVINGTEYSSKVSTAVAAGKGPDVVMLDNTTLPAAAARSVVESIDEVAQALGYDEQQFGPAVWAAGSYDGKRYGIPLGVYPHGFYFNRTVMERAGLDPAAPPQSRADYEAALEELKRAGIKGHWMAVTPFPGSEVFQTLTWQNGGDLFDIERSEAVFDSDAGVEALSWELSLVERGYSPRNVGDQADLIAFKNGQAAFVWHGPWNINDFDTVKGLDWGAAPVPTIGEQPAVWAGSHQLSVATQRSRDADSLAATKVFINDVCEQSLEWGKAGQVPALRSVRESADFRALTAQAAFAQQLDRVRLLPPSPGVADALVPLQTAYNQVMLGKKKPREALGEAAQQATRILKENKESYGS